MSVNLGTAGAVQAIKDINVVKAVAGLGVSAAACTVVATEMAFQALHNITHPNEQDASYNLSANLGGAIFYGLCAANVIAGTSMIGAVIFGAYTVKKIYDGKQGDRDYLTVRAIDSAVRAIGDGLILVRRTVLDIGKAISPFVRECFAPVLRVAYEIGKIIFKVLEPFLELITRIPLPEHPIWVGVFCLTGAIVLQQYALPVLLGPAL